LIFERFVVEWAGCFSEARRAGMFCSPHREVWVDGIFLDSSPTRIPHERSECGVKGGRHSIKDMVRIVFAFREFQQFDKFLFVCLVFVMFPADCGYIFLPRPIVGLMLKAPYSICHEKSLTPFVFYPSR